MNNLDKLMNDLKEEINMDLPKQTFEQKLDTIAKRASLLMFLSDAMKEQINDIMTVAYPMTMILLTEPKSEIIDRKKQEVLDKLNEIINVLIGNVIKRLEDLKTLPIETIVKKMTGGK